MKLSTKKTILYFLLSASFLIPIINIPSKIKAQTCSGSVYSSTICKCTPPSTPSGNFRCTSCGTSRACAEQGGGCKGEYLHQTCSDGPTGCTYSSLTTHLITNGCYYDYPDDPDPGDPDPGDPGGPTTVPDANCPDHKPSKWCVPDGHPCTGCINKGIQLSYCAPTDPQLCCCDDPNPDPDPPKCGDPGRTTVTVTDITNDSATINWTGVGWGGEEDADSCVNSPDNPRGCAGRNWLVEIRLDGNRVELSSCIPEGDRSWEVTGLNPGTQYEYRVWSINGCAGSNPGCDKRAIGGFSTRSNPFIIDASAPDEVCIGTQIGETINLSSSYSDLDPSPAGRLHDINLVQLNFEREDNSTYSGGLWPMRLMFAQTRTGFSDNSFQFGAENDSTGLDWTQNIATSAGGGKYYLDTDVPVSNDGGDLYYEVMSGVNNTYFQINSELLEAYWEVDLRPDFPIPNDRQTYNVTSYVEDLGGGQDEDGDVSMSTKCTNTGDEL